MNLRQHNAHIHVTTNVIPHEGDYEGLRGMAKLKYGVTALSQPHHRL